MARQSECEHDILVYRIIGGSGLDVTEECSECGTRITNESPKTKFNREKQEEAEKKAPKKATSKKEETKTVNLTTVKFNEKDDEDFWVKDQVPKSTKKQNKKSKYDY